MLTNEEWKLVHVKLEDLFAVALSQGDKLLLDKPTDKRGVQLSARDIVSTEYHPLLGDYGQYVRLYGYFGGIRDGKYRHR